MSDVLAEIVGRKRADVAKWRSERSAASLEAEARLAPAPRGFIAALRAAIVESGFGLIAEIKKASPSHGLIRPDFNPPALARAYESAGAACLSVLTDGPYFQGRPADLKAAREAVPLPVLRKDFTLDPWQVAEARAMGADCILLIMAALDDGQAIELTAAAHAYGMDVLVEVHDRAELERALRLEPSMVGVNNRDLKTLRTSLDVSLALARHLPDHVLGVSESGITSHADLQRLGAGGLRASLVGESLLRHDDVAAATHALLTGTA